MIRQHGPVGEPPYHRGGSSYSHASLYKAPLNGYTANVVAPLNGFKSLGNDPTFTVRGSSTRLPTVDLQVEFRQRKATQVSSQPVGKPPLDSDPWTPDPTYVVEVSSVVSGSVQQIKAPEPLKNFSWFYRVRAGNKTDNIWGRWSPQQYIDILPPIGTVTQYVDFNVGIVNENTPKTTAYVDMNIGIKPMNTDTPTAYVDMNIGAPQRYRTLSQYLDMNVYPRIARTRRQAFYADMNVDDSRPDPVIWWVRPQQGREGYVFNIYGHGFGDFQNEYDGVVKLGNLVCQVSRWEVIPEDTTVQQHLIKHGLNAADDVITPEHGWIVAIVPDGAVSANVNVILRSE